MSTAAVIPLRERFNFRIILFILVIAAMAGGFLYLFLQPEVRDRGDYKEVDLKAMSDFPFDQQRGTIEDIPAQWRALDGQRILVTGEIWAPNSRGPELKQFELVYSITQCCFSGPPQIQHFVEAIVPEGTVPHYRGLVKVLGTLHVNVERGEDGRVARVYRMEVERVEPA